MSTKVLIANRGEIAIRMARAAAEMGIASVAVYSEDDSESLHRRMTDEAQGLSGSGPAAYLDGGQIVQAALDSGSTLVHPGYGFLSENADFARRCAEAGLTFVGPRPETLELFGDKARARGLAEECGVPVLPGTAGGARLEDIRNFAEEHGAVIIKAVAGGGGRGMRVVTDPQGLDEAYERCQSEATVAFGSGAVYAERLIERARHIEVQIAGDGSGGVTHFGERECSLQRRHQKLVEIAPSPNLPDALRRRLIDAAVSMATKTEYLGLGTFEFLVNADSVASGEAEYVFIEANARLQVEHTVTEEVTGVDLVRTQLALAQGATLQELALTQDAVPEIRGHAIQVRVNMETMDSEGNARPAGGTLTAFETPTGPGVRTDTFGYAGYATSPRFDSLLAKVIAHSNSADYGEALSRAKRALREFRIEGVQTNLGYLQNLLDHPDVVSNEVYTRFVERHAAELASATSVESVFATDSASGSGNGQAGVRVDPGDPLAVLDHGKSGAAGAPIEASTPVTPAMVAGPDGTRAVPAPMQGTVVSIDVREGDAVSTGRQLMVMEAMKMEHTIEASFSGYVRAIPVSVGDTLYEGHALVFVEEADVASEAAGDAQSVDLDSIRPDLAEVLERHGFGLDDARPEAVAKRRKTGHRTARENIADLCDAGSFVEYGPLVIAAQRMRRSEEDLIRNTPADGMIAGTGRINGAQFGEDAAQCVVLSYDYTVLAGTQGKQNHEKKDRIFELAERWRKPLVFFTEGGGGRPGDTDVVGVAGLDCHAFHYFAKLSGLVPLVGITTGRCFAGNAVLLGCCDVIIATEGSNIGVGGPAMIEGGGLGVFRPEEVGPMEVQVPNGVVDIPVKDEAEAVAAARKYLSYFQGPVEEWDCADQRRLRHAIPENRLRIYDVREIIETLADTGSVLELRRDFGHGIITVFARVEGKPVGIVANNPAHLAGAIDREGADKGARFMQLCDAFDIPILFLCDCPGIMVGPEIEKTALVRHAARMFVVGASLDVPFFTIVLRKGYGLGAQAMAGGGFKAPMFTVTWPTGEFGGMGLEGAVKLGFRKELAAIEDPEKRRETYESMVAAAYERGKAGNMASHFELDDVIDPKDSRDWIASALRSAPKPSARAGKKRPCVDTW